MLLKFLCVKGMVFLGNIQGYLIGFVIQCGVQHTLSAANLNLAQVIWGYSIFLVELPFVAAFFGKAFRRQDFENSYMPSINDPTVSVDGTGAYDADAGLETVNESTTEA